jgi:hypothetical protein
MCISFSCVHTNSFDFGSPEDVKMIVFVRSHKLMIYKIWGYLSLRMGGYRLFKYANMIAQTPNKITKDSIISWTVMYPVYQKTTMYSY